MMLAKERDVLLLDGDCGLCHRLAQFINRRRRKELDLEFRPIESEEGKKLISNLPEKQQNADSVYLIRNGKSYIRSAAGIRVLLYLKWYWKIWFPIVWIVPFPFRDIVYRLIAKFRHRIFRPPASCVLPGN